MLGWHLLPSPGDALKKEIGHFPILLMELPPTSDLVQKVEKFQKKMTKLAEESLGVLQ